MKEKPVGVDGNRFEADFTSRFDRCGQIRVQGRFAAQKDQVGVFAATGECAQPFFDNGQGKGFSAMLLRVDVAVGAAEVTAGENMEKDIDGIFGKIDGMFHRLFKQSIFGSRPL